MKKWNDLKKELLLNKQVADEYEKLEPKYKLIGDLIEARLKKGLTQEQLAYKAKLSSKYIGQIERGRVKVTIETIDKLATALKLKIHVLTKKL